MLSLRLGSVQVAGLQIYILDDAHEPVPGLALAGDVLAVENVEAAMEAIMDATNSADDDGDRAIRDALSALWSRIAKAA